ncbi:MAG: hypothetical protein QF752_00075 [Planctomycetota bacterium]|nr:hypothetical protein [Planctomycetota bacterium]
MPIKPTLPILFLLFLSHTVMAEIGTPYQKLSKTDFVKFFNIHEVGRETSEAGSTLINLKPGGFKQHIDIQISIDASGVIRSASLRIDRSWLGDHRTINRLGSDLVKSFLATFSPQKDLSRVTPLIQAIWNSKGTRDRVVRLKGNPEPPSARGQALEGLETFMGNRASYTLSLSSATLSLNNGPLDGRQRLQCEVRSLSPTKSAD